MLPPRLRYFIKHEIEDIFDLLPVLILGVGLAFAILILLLFVNTEPDPAATQGPAGGSAPVAEDAAPQGTGTPSTAAVRISCIALPSARSLSLPVSFRWAALEQRERPSN